MGKNECGLTPEIESIVSDWQLYRSHGTPPVLALEFYDSLSEKQRVNLSVEQFLSYSRTKSAAYKSTASRLPRALEKPWKYVTDYLIDNQKMTEVDE